MRSQKRSPVLARANPRKMPSRLVRLPVGTGIKVREAVWWQMTDTETSVRVDPAKRSPSGEKMAQCTVTARFGGPVEFAEVVVYIPDQGSEKANKRAGIIRAKELAGLFVASVS